MKEQKNKKNIKDVAENYSFPNYYKECPKCGSKDIFFTQNITNIMQRSYKIKDSIIDITDFTVNSRTKVNFMNNYSCNNCEWFDYGGTTWYKE